jgi:2-(1,2-epoxy-1,2-dihydrophenyl)acetyl-CoA isomerase
MTLDGGSTLLTSTLGLHRVLHLALLNPEMTAREAQDAGLVARVCSDDQLGFEVERIVVQLVSGSWPAQVAVKHLLRERETPDAESSMRRESLAVHRSASGADSREGIRAFLTKRVPRFPSGDQDTL